MHTQTVSRDGRQTNAHPRFLNVLFGLLQRCSSLFLLRRIFDDFVAAFVVDLLLDLLGLDFPVALVPVGHRGPRFLDFPVRLAVLQLGLGFLLADEIVEDVAGHAGVPLQFLGKRGVCER